MRMAPALLALNTTRPERANASPGKHKARLAPAVALPRRAGNQARPTP